MTARLFASAPKVTQRDTGERLKAPSRCQICDQPTQNAFLAVRDGARNRVGAPSDFLDKGSLRPEFVFLGWIARCADHYLRDLYRTKRGVWSAFAEDRDGIPTIDDYRRLHGNGACVRGSADGGDARREAADMGADQDDLAGPGSLPDGMEGDG